ncbi:hypothetical protein ACROYT_G043223, partial [Oculina patagonica]
KWAIPENIRTIPRTAFWKSEGKGGFFELEFRRHGGILTIGISKAWGSSRSWISRGENKSVFLENAYFADYQFANKAQTDDRVAEAGYKTSIDRSGMCLRSFTKKKSLKCGFYIKLQRP